MNAIEYNNMYLIIIMVYFSGVNAVECLPRKAHLGPVARTKLASAVTHDISLWKFQIDIGAGLEYFKFSSFKYLLFFHNIL